MATPKLCLNMIVKNESKIIRRLLESVSPVIDAFCICDTGSTDDTVSIIESFFRQKNIPGKVIKEPFKNFEYNRSFALKACDELTDIDYILLMDADMILWMNKKITPESFKKLLAGQDCFYIFQGSDSMYYKNTRVVKNRAGFSYKGVTHEYVELPPNAKQGVFVKDLVFIKDIGDGGSKSDKFERDMRLLKEGLRQDPKNERYMFYLANSIKDLASTHTHQTDYILSQMNRNCEELVTSFSSRPAVLKLVGYVTALQEKVKTEQEIVRKGYLNEAIEWYLKRIKAGGFWEEVWYSHYNIGHAYFHLKDHEKALYYFHKAYVLFPQRVENIYEIVKHYRENGENELAVHYYLLGKTSLEKYKCRDYLFIQKDIYDYKLDYEMSILGYYTNPNKIDMSKLSMDILSQHIQLDENIVRNILSNYKFYSQPLRDIDTKTHTQWGDVMASIGSKPQDIYIPSEFSSSTPTFCHCSNSDTYYGLVRYVDYKVNATGGYDQLEKIQTINVMASVTKQKDNWVIHTENTLKYDATYDNVYVGIEDVRVFYHKPTDKIYYTGNRGLGNGKMVIEHGWINRISFKTEDSRFLQIENQQAVEKNWVMFSYPDDPAPIYMVYNWYPMTIGKVNGGTLEITKKIETPFLFKYIRGSTNGMMVNDEIWFLCHVVSYEERRYYYHIMVMLDKKSLELRRTSKMFTFEKEKVEYCLGMDLEGDDVRFGISVMDRHTKYISVPRKWF